MSAVEGLDRKGTKLEEVKRHAQIGWLQDRLHTVALNVGGTSAIGMKVLADGSSLGILEMEIQALCDKKRQERQTLTSLIQNRLLQEFKFQKMIAEQRNNEIEEHKLKQKFEVLMGKFQALRENNLVALKTWKNDQQAARESSAIKFEKLKLLNTKKAEVQTTDYRLVQTCSAIDDLLNLEKEVLKPQVKVNLHLDHDEEHPRKVRPSKSQQINLLQSQQQEEELAALQTQLSSLRYSNSVIEKGNFEPEELESAISIISKLNRRLQYRIERHSLSKHKKTVSQPVIN